MPRKKGPYRRKPKDTPARPKSNFVREWREWADLTQEDLAGDSGLSLSSISAYERGDNDPSLEALAKLADALGVPKGMILDIDPTTDPPLWNGYLRASERQRQEIGRLVGAIIGPMKPKPRP